MTKVVINTCFGGFGLSPEAEALLRDRGVSDYDWEIPRDHPELVRVVEELGVNADGRLADLKVVEIPDGVDWYIAEYDGIEHVAERHRTWR